MVIFFINPVTRPPPKITWTEELTQYSINGHIIAKKESFTEVVCLCKDRMLVKAIQVGCCFYDSYEKFFYKSC